MLFRQPLVISDVVAKRWGTKRPWKLNRIQLREFREPNAETASVIETTASAPAQAGREVAD